MRTWRIARLLVFVVLLASIIVPFVLSFAGLLT